MEALLELNHPDELPEFVSFIETALGSPIVAERMPNYITYPEGAYAYKIIYHPEYPHPERVSYNSIKMAGNLLFIGGATPVNSWRIYRAGELVASNLSYEIVEAVVKAVIKEVMLNSVADKLDLPLG